MPWKVSKRGDQYCVLKSDDGSTVKCHDSRAEALAHMRALYVNVKTEEPLSGLGIVASVIDKFMPGGMKKLAEWTTAYKNDLPDSAFAHIEAGGKKDKDGKTTPRSLRHYPHHDASGKLDLTHLRAALSRVGDSSNVQGGQSHLRSHAKSAGVGKYVEPELSDEDIDELELDELVALLEAVVLDGSSSGADDEVLLDEAYAEMRKKRKTFRPGYSEEQLALELAEYGSSWEDIEKQVYKAVCDYAMHNGASNYYMYNFATYSDHVVAECDGEFWDYPYAIGSDGVVTVSEPKKVARDYKPVRAYELTEQVVIGTPLGSVAELKEGKPIQIMKVGTFDHPEHGEFSITDADLTSMVRNFNSQVRGQDVPVDIDHIHEGGAVGWFKSLTHHKDGTLWATVDWTDEGEQLLEGGKFKYFSPHFGPWKDPETGHEYSNVLWSGSITNFPFLKGMQAIALSEFTAKRREIDLERRENMELSEALEQLKALTERVERSEEAKSAAEEAQKQLTEANEKMQQAVETMQHDALVRRCTEIVHGSGDPNKRWITANEEQTVTLVVKLAEDYGEDSDTFKQFVSEKEADATRVRESIAMAEIGATGITGVTANVTGPRELEDFDAEVTKALTEGRAKTQPEALRLVSKEKPALYNKYRENQLARQRQRS